MEPSMIATFFAMPDIKYRKDALIGVGTDIDLAFVIHFRVNYVCDTPSRR